EPTGWVKMNQSLFHLFRRSKIKRVAAVAAPKLVITIPSPDETNAMAFNYADQWVTEIRPTALWPEKRVTALACVLRQTVTVHYCVQLMPLHDTEKSNLLVKCMLVSIWRSTRINE